MSAMDFCIDCNYMEIVVATFCSFTLQLSAFLFYNIQTVTAVGLGNATITCSSTDGSGIIAESNVTVIQMINSIKIVSDSSTITVNKNESINLSTVITPEDATDKKLSWESSNAEIATVDKDGTVTAVSGGAATISCIAKDGSEKTANISIYVPSIAVQQSEYSVSSKDGIDIAIKYYGKREDFTLSYSSSLFDVYEKHNGEDVSLSVIPNHAGTGSITLTDKSDSRSTVKLSVTIEHSACYDAISYPTGDYVSIMRSPSQHNGEKMSIYGRVLQISNGWGTTMRIATAGWDNVFYVTCPTSVAEGIIEDDYVTIYGECYGTETYTTILGGSVTIPGMKAEKVYLGKH